MFLVELGDEHIVFQYQRVTVVTYITTNIQNMLINGTLSLPKPIQKENDGSVVRWPVISLFVVM